MSNRPLCSASAKFARTPTGTPMRLRRETGSAGPSAITSAATPSSSARRPATRSDARVEGGQHRHLVAEHAELAGEALDVLVDLMRPRPRKGGDEADAESHDAPSLVRAVRAARRAGRPLRALKKWS